MYLLQLITVMEEVLQAPTLVPTLNLHLHQLRYLATVAEVGTLTEAARQLAVSQPALSQSLTELERRLGVPLFERAGRRRVLTEAGREVARYAGEVLGRTGELARWPEHHRAGAGGTLRVGMIDAASLYVLPAAIGTFRDRHPDVGLLITVESSEALIERLRRFELDLAVVVGPVGDEWDTRLLGVESWLVYGSADGGDDPEQPGVEWALYPSGSHTRAAIDAGLALLGWRPAITLESSNPQILRQVVALGLGWSVLPRAVARNGEPPLLPWRKEPIAERPLLIVRRRHAPPDARVEAFVGCALADAEVE